MRPPTWGSSASRCTTTSSRRSANAFRACASAKSISTTNYNRICATPGYGYSWGVGIQSQTYAEENFFHIDTTAIASARIISRFNGTNLHEAGSLVGTAPNVDLVAEYNAVNDPDLVPTVAWAPALFTNLHNARAVPKRVVLQAGTAAVRPPSLSCR